MESPFGWIKMNRLFYLLIVICREFEEKVRESSRHRSIGVPRALPALPSSTSQRYYYFIIHIYIRNFINLLS